MHLKQMALLWRTVLSVLKRDMPNIPAWSLPQLTACNRMQHQKNSELL